MFFIRVMEQIFSFGERLNVPFNEAKPSTIQLAKLNEKLNVPFNSASPPMKNWMYHSTRLCLVEWNISSFTSWKFLYHCTHKHSLFVYYTELSCLTSHFCCCISRLKLTVVRRSMKIIWWMQCTLYVMFTGQNLTNPRGLVVDKGHVVWSRALTSNC